MKAKYPEAYDALITHSNRYKILYDKLSEHTEYTRQTMDFSVESMHNRIEILGDLVDTALLIVEDYKSVVKEMEHNRNIAQTALRAYAEFYGTELVVPEGFIDFDSKFNMQASVIPTKGKTTITVEVEEIDDD